MPKLEIKEIDLLRDGEYKAEIVSIQQVTGRYGEQLEWLFELPFQETTRTAWCSLVYSELSKFGKWVKALYGKLPESIDTDELIGQKCMLKLSLKTREDGSQYNRVERIISPIDETWAPQKVELAETEELPF